MASDCRVGKRGNPSQYSIPAAFVRHELQAFGLQLTLYETVVLEESFDPLFLDAPCLDAHKHPPIERLKAMLIHPFLNDYVFPDGTSVCIFDDDVEMDSMDAVEAGYPYTFSEALAVIDKLKMARQLQTQEIIAFLWRIYDEKQEK